MEEKIRKFCEDLGVTLIKMEEIIIKGVYKACILYVNKVSDDIFFDIDSEFKEVNIVLREA